MASLVPPGPFQLTLLTPLSPLCPDSRISRSSFHAPPAFYSAILEYCSCYTVAGTDRGQLFDIPLRGGRSWCIDLELRRCEASRICRLETDVSGKLREKIHSLGRFDNARFVHFDFAFPPA